jgi:lipopolysaccharide biosynthesis glycosyltransferase
LAKDDIAGAAINFLSRNTNCVYLDQDALNHVMEGKYLQLDERWNSLAINTDDYCLSNGTEESMEIARKWRRDPWIVHFAGPKPWRAGQDKTPTDHYFWNAARRTVAYENLKTLHRDTTPAEADYSAVRKFAPTTIETVLAYCRKLRGG